MPRWDDDGSAAAQRAENRAERMAQRQERAERFERAERNERTRDFLGLDDRPGRGADDVLGLRLMGDAPSLAEQYGVSLLDSATRADIDSWDDRVEIFSRRTEPGVSDIIAAARGPASNGPSWSAGSGLGGPSVSIDKGPPEYSVSIPLGLGGVEIGHKDKYWSFGAQLGVDFKYLAEIGVGFTYRPGASPLAADGEPQRWETHIQGRVLAIGVKVPLQTIADKLDQINQEAARRMAPEAEMYLRQLGLPLPP